MVRIDAGSKMDWKAGVFDRMGVVISKDATTTVSTDGLKRQADSYIVVDGRMDWLGGDVQTLSTSGAAGSQLAISQSGKFYITVAGGQLWGTGQGVSSEFLVSNYGTISLIAGGTVTIGGDYYTTGQTILKQGIFKITGKAEQAGGGMIRPIGRTTVDVSTAKNGTLYNLDGSVSGDGTVQGSLSLGKEGVAPAAGGSVTAAVAIDQNGNEIDAAATLNVTGKFFMWNYLCAVRVGVGASGAVRKLEIGETALLAGELTVFWHSNYRPAPTMSITFMTYAGARTGAFQREYFYPPSYDINGVPVRIDLRVPSQWDEGVTAVVNWDIDNP